MTQAGYVVFCLLQFVPLVLQLSGAKVNGIVLLVMSASGALAIVVGLRLRKLHIQPASEVLDATTHTGRYMSDRLWNTTIFLQFLIVLQLVVVALAAGAFLLLHDEGFNFEMQSPERTAFFVWVIFGVLVFWTAMTALALAYVIRKRRRHEAKPELNG